MHHADVIVAAAASDTQRAVMMAMTMLMKMKIVAVAGVIGGVIVVFGLVSQKYLHFKTNSSPPLLFPLPPHLFFNFFLWAMGVMVALMMRRHIAGQHSATITNNQLTLFLSFQTLVCPCRAINFLFTGFTVAPQDDTPTMMNDWSPPFFFGVAVAIFCFI